MSKHNPLIIALDTSSPLKAIRLVQKLKVTGVAFKVGFELFSAAGPRIISRLLSHEVRVFLDLKFHDIPHTVAQAVDVATRMGVWMLNVHASGGSEMMKAAKEAALGAAQKEKIPPPLVVGVTVLTSLKDLSEINISQPVGRQVQHLAALSKSAGLDGVVASGHEAGIIRQECGSNFCIVTPGIRLPSQNADDQKRVMSPREAIEQGSNYLVIGRPVTQAARPIQVIDKILQSIRKV